MTNKELRERVKHIESELSSIKEQLAPKKITLREFFESKQELAIHCNTEEKAKQLLSAFDKMGKKWNTGNRYTEFNNWNNYGQIIYYNDGTYATLRSIESNVCMVYEFEDIDLTIPKEYQFSEEEKTILRNLNEFSFKKWKWLARDKNGILYVYTHRPIKSSENYTFSDGSWECFNIFGHLFQSIQWTDDEPVEIAKVIRG